jgi:hypothetical protein
LFFVFSFNHYTFFLSALTTSSFRDPQGATFVGAACDLSLPMLSKLRFQFSVLITLRVFEPRLHSP